MSCDTACQLSSPSRTTAVVRMLVGGWSSWYCDSVVVGAIITRATVMLDGYCELGASREMSNDLPGYEQCIWTGSYCLAYNATDPSAKVARGQNYYHQHLFLVRFE